jgi:hypothetical protein
LVSDGVLKVHIRADAVVLAEGSVGYATSDNCAVLVYLTALNYCYFELDEKAVEIDLLILG